MPDLRLTLISALAANSVAGYKFLGYAEGTIRPNTVTCLQNLPDKMNANLEGLVVQGVDIAPYFKLSGGLERRIFCQELRRALLAFRREERERGRRSGNGRQEEEDQQTA